MVPDARIATPENLHVPLAQAGEFAPLSIGPLSVWPPVVLAPMAGVTNLPFRSLCREYGAGLYVSEMITARAWLLGNRRTLLLASSAECEKPRSVQIYGSDPKDVGEMARGLVEQGVDHLDLNFGCPVPKVTRLGGGSAIPLKPRLLARILRATVKSAGAVPVTIKVRKGIDESLTTCFDAGRVAEEEGAAAIGLHARTAAQLYSGEADWNAIRELKSRVSIPVLGNGDVWECWDALRMLRETRCDGVIVGRGCLGRPWLFRELAQVFDGREPDAPPALGAIVRIMEDHAQRLVAFFGEREGMLQMRKWCAWYTKGFAGSASVRAVLSKLDSLEDMRRELARLDPAEPFPLSGLRAHRAKGSRTQRVALPEGYLDALDDDTPPRSPHDAEELAAWEQSLSGG
jgi:nifR3 family TIM-barrel protein